MLNTADALAGRIISDQKCEVEGFDQKRQIKQSRKWLQK